MKNLKSALFTGMMILFLSSMATSQELTMFPGIFKVNYYQDKNQISKTQFESKLMTINLANSHWKTAKKHTMLGLLGAGIGLGSVVWGVYNITNDKKMALPVIGYFAGLGMEIGFLISSNKHKRLAILEYNEGIESKTTMKLAPTNNGMGLLVTF